MGIIKRKLCEFELECGKKVVIEWNEDAKVHIHIDNIRYSFSREEFDNFYTILDEAAEQLAEIKNHAEK